MDAVQYGAVLFQHREADKQSSGIKGERRTYRWLQPIRKAYLYVKYHEKVSAYTNRTAVIAIRLSHCAPTIQPRHLN